MTPRNSSTGRRPFGSAGAYLQDGGKARLVKGRSEISFRHWQSQVMYVRKQKANCGRLWRLYVVGLRPWLGGLVFYREFGRTINTMYRNINGNKIEAEIQAEVGAA